MRQTLEKIRKKGRGGDTILAHLSPVQASLLKQVGGSGTINPETGLREFKGGFFRKPLKAFGGAAPGLVGAGVGNLFMPGFGGMMLGGALGGTGGNILRGRKDHLNAAARGSVLGAGGIVGGEVLSRLNKSPDFRTKNPNAPGQIGQAGGITSANINPGARTAGTMAPEELQVEIQKLIAGDTARLQNTNFSKYPGAEVAPMSTLTQRANQLEDRRARKGMPYQKTLQNLASTPASGMSQGNIQSIMDNLQGEHMDFSQNVIGDRLGKQFGRSGIPYQGSFNRNLQTDTGLKMGEVGSELDSINDIIKKLESQKASTGFDAITNASTGKNLRQQSLIGDLKDYGDQKHRITNKLLTADKARFEGERDAPQQRLQMLQQAMDGIDVSKMHPDESGQNFKVLEKALQAYGVDLTKPVSEWGDANRISTPGFQGKLVEPINQDIQSSFDLAESIDPKYQDQNYRSRKDLRHSIGAPFGAMNRITGELPEKIRPQFDAINAEAMRKAGADMNTITASQIRKGNYGSQPHQLSANQRLRELNEATLGAKSQAMESGLMQGVTSDSNEHLDKIRRMSGQDQMANTEFSDILGNIKNTNLRGIEKWKNDQAGNERIFRSFGEEAAHQNPKLTLANKRQGFGQGVNAVFDQLGQGIDFSKISDLQGRYDSQNKELMQARNQIQNQGQFRAAQAAPQQVAHAPQAVQQALQVKRRPWPKGHAPQAVQQAKRRPWSKGAKLL